MTRKVIALVVALMLFTASAVGSWFLQQKMNADSAEKKSEASAKAAHREPAVHAATKPTKGEEAAPRPAVRAAQSPDAEYVSKLAADLQRQREDLGKREQQLTARQKNLDLVYQEIRKEQKSLEELRKQIDDEMKLLADKADLLDRKVADLKQQGGKVAEQNKEFKLTMMEVDDAEKSRVKQMAAFYDAMDAEAAAQTFQEMVDGGKADMAVKILSNMRERQAARVLGQLAQLPNNGTAVQLLDRLKGLKSPPGK